ncbi:MAG: tryptophan--tRNA ligase [Candidatus Spechtbacteria bacterium SB0662_bin_43]|uniref:Tryptophan--tRNA ligase n=1 Tax=Candidatus Spechtbacteria bacterium SB0662_bin_43 TaxID=2604897 RepID=A0A845D9W1_9BACT|nr:tryptophan--tRNA ligase [Candidatus Spechtbacteria bacterium SB0662_bin_43]
MRILSGIQPTGNLHIGNYVGAFKQFQDLQDKGHECFFSVVDLHALTALHDRERLHTLTQEAKRVFCAVGLTQDNTALFVQSTVPQHTQLTWILSTLTPIGESERMTQFKDKKAQGMETNTGLFIYPILMAADILLYKTDAVPVGEDQLQHLELTRTIARKFNAMFGDTFKEPQAITEQSTARIMSLKDPTKKMSKSLGETHYIGILEDEKTIREKIQHATTDSETTIQYSPKSKPGISNLLALYSAFATITIQQAEEHFSRTSYAALKEEVATTLLTHLKPIRETFYSLSEDEVNSHFESGRARATHIAQTTLNEVYQKVGLC